MSCGSQTCNPSHTILPPAGTHVPRLPFLGHVVQWLIEAQVQWRRREELRELDDRILRDVGLTREQIERAARWSIW